MEKDLADLCALYDKALYEFEKCSYGIAVEIFIELYEAGYQKDQILEDLYRCFVMPNEQEFLENFETQAAMLGISVQYEDLTVDFMPISDTSYYIFNKETMSFCGKIDMASFKNDDCGLGTFQSLLICDLWNPVDFMQKYYEKDWQKIYLCFEQDIERLFFSFMKLPGMSVLIDVEKTVFLSGREAYVTYFCKDASKYIPRVIYGNNIYLYEYMNQEIHNYRLSKPAGDHVFLTIAIPTYNRGEIALDNVKQLISLKYDSEVEILISNNGSTENVDGYREIAALQDSRITYFAFENNREFFDNVLKVLSIGRGRFIMLTSDEDRMFLQNLDDYLDFLYNNPAVGVVRPSGTGNNMIQHSKEIISDPKEKMFYAFNQNYLTGITFNSAVLRENRALERIRVVRDKNIFAWFYPHVVLALIACERNAYASSDVLIWYEPKYETDTADEMGILSYMHPVERFHQLDASVDLIFNFMDISRYPKVQICLFDERMSKVYYLLYIAFILRAEAMSAAYDWINTCIEIWKHNNELINSYRDRVGASNADFLVEQNLLMFREYIMKNPSESIQSPQQIHEYMSRRDKLLKELEIN